MQNGSQNKPNVTLETIQVSSEALLENNPPYNYDSNQSTAHQTLQPDKMDLSSEYLPRWGPPCPQGANAGWQAPNSLESRGLSLQLDLSSTTDKMAGPAPGQMLLHAPQQDLPRYSLPLTHGPPTPEWGCTAMSTDSHSGPGSTEATFPCEQPAGPESPSLPTAPKTAPLLPLSDLPVPEPAPSTLPYGDPFTTTAPSPPSSEILSLKTASPLPTSELLTSDTGASSSCTHLPPSPGPLPSPAHLDQVTEAEQRFRWETQRGGDMQNSSQNKPNVTLETTQESSEELLEKNPPDHYHSNQATANQNLPSVTAQNGGPPSKYRTRNYEEACEKQTFKPKTIRFTDTFRF